MKEIANDNPKVSILIPVYNREKLLGPCIESALAQTYRDIEVVVVDNCSTDRTWEVCQKYKKADERVRVFQNERNLGPVGNWKRCIELARGEFGKILFSDDLISPTFVEKTLSYFENARVGFVFTATEIGPERGQGDIAYLWKQDSAAVKSFEFIHDSYLTDVTPVSPGCAIFRLASLRKNLVSEIPSPRKVDCSSHGAGADLLLFLLTAHDYPLIAYVNEPLSFFRLHGGSFSVDGLEGKVREGYLHALSWFGESHFNQPVFHRFLVRLGIQEIRRQKRWLTFSDCWRPYLHKPDLPINTSIMFRESYQFLRSGVRKMCSIGS